MQSKKRKEGWYWITLPHGRKVVAQWLDGLFYICGVPVPLSENETARSVIGPRITEVHRAK